MLIAISGFSQNKISGKYEYYTYTLILYDDSTFHIDFRFDLFIDIGHGNYIVKNDTLILNYTKLFDSVYYYDTINVMSRPNDQKSEIQINKPKIKLYLVQNDEFDIQLKDTDYDEICCSIGSGNIDFPKKLYHKSNKLFHIDLVGRIIKRSKARNLYGKKIKPAYFKRV